MTFVVLFAALGFAAPIAHATTTASISGTTLTITNDAAAASASVGVTGSDFEVADNVAAVAGAGCSLNGSQHALCPTGADEVKCVAYGICPRSTGV